MEGGSVSDNRDEFLFLLGVQKGMTFENIEKLLDEIANEKVKLGIPSPTNLFKKQYCPTKKDCKFFHLWCSYCSAKINCKVLEDGTVLVTAIKHNHLHTTAKFESQVEGEIYRVYVWRSTKEAIRIL